MLSLCSSPAQNSCEDMSWNATPNSSLTCITDQSVATDNEQSIWGGPQSFINYSAVIYCNTHLSPIGLLFATGWLVLLFVTLATTTDDFFCPSLEMLAKALRLSQNVAGVTLLAFGNGAPEIFASLAGTTNDRPELVVSYLLGSGMFLTCVVAGVIMILTPFKMVERPFLRDIIFYLVAIFWTYWLVYNQHISFHHALGFICLYVVYIAFVLIAHHIYQKWLKPKRLKKAATTAPQVTLVDVDLNTNPDPPILQSNIVLTGDEIMPWGGPPYVKNSWSTSCELRKESKALISSIATTLQSSDNYTPKKSSNHSKGPCVECELAKDLKKAPCLESWRREACDFFHAILPVDVSSWGQLPVWQKMMQIFRAPVVVLMKLTVPVVTCWCRSLNMFHCVTTPAFLLLATDYWNVMIGDCVPLWTLSLAVGIILAVMVFCSSCPHRPPPYHMIFAIVEFWASVTWIYVIANEIVALLTTVGLVLGISDSILGLTILAWGNSVSDVVADISIAKEGFPRMGLSACFGGPLFNLLLGLGISFTIATLQTPARTMKIAYESTTMILTAFLCASLVSSLIIVPLMRFQMGRAFGIYLLLLYGLFVTTIILNEFNFFHIHL